MKKIVLGFDVSSSTIGHCALEIDQSSNSIKFLECNYFKPSKKGPILENLIQSRKHINEIIHRIKPDYIAIEDLIKFMVKSTATTVVVLTTYNRMVCLAAHDYLNALPELINVMTIRHGLKISKVLPKKEEMPELVAKHLNINFPYLYNKNKKKRPENEDMADAIAVALYYSFILTNRIKKKIKKEPKKRAKKRSL